MTFIARYSSAAVRRARPRFQILIGALAAIALGGGCGGEDSSGASESSTTTGGAAGGGSDAGNPCPGGFVDAGVDTRMPKSGPLPPYPDHGTRPGCCAPVEHVFCDPDIGTVADAKFSKVTIVCPKYFICARIPGQEAEFGCRDSNDLYSHPYVCDLSTLAGCGSQCECGPNEICGYHPSPRGATEVDFGEGYSGCCDPANDCTCCDVSTGRNCFPYLK
jgi:hypothetical protein